MGKSKKSSGGNKTLLSNSLVSTCPASMSGEEDAAGERGGGGSKSASVRHKGKGNGQGSMSSSSSSDENLPLLKERILLQQKKMNTANYPPHPHRLDNPRNKKRVGTGSGKKRSSSSFNNNNNMDPQNPASSSSQHQDPRNLSFLSMSSSCNRVAEHPEWLAPQVRVILALLCVAGMLFSWVVMAEVMQELEVRYNFKRPFFMSWFVHNSYIVFLIPWGISEYVYQSTRPHYHVFQWSLLGFISLPLNLIGFCCVYFWYLSVSETNIAANTSIYQSSCAFVFVLSVCFLREPVNAMKISSVILCIIGVFVISFSNTQNINTGGGGGSHNRSLTATSNLDYYLKSDSLFDSYSSHNNNNNPLGGGFPSSSSSTDGGFNITNTIVPNPIFPSGNSYSKSSSSSSSSGGGGQQSHETVRGYVLCVVSTLLYALYEVLYRKWGLDPRRVYRMCNAYRALAFMGVGNLLFLWPGLLIVHYVGMEPFEVPSIGVIKTLCVVSLFDSFYQVLLLCGILLTSPLFMSVGTMLTIPATIFADLILRDYTLPKLSFVGIFGVIMGFVGLNLSEFKEVEEEEEDHFYGDAYLDDLIEEQEGVVDQPQQGGGDEHNQNRNLTLMEAGELKGDGGGGGGVVTGRTSRGTERDRLLP